MQAQPRSSRPGLRRLLGTLSLRVGLWQEALLRRPGRWLAVAIPLLLALAGGALRLEIDNRTERWLEGSTGVEADPDHVEFFLLVRRGVDARSAGFLVEDRRLARDIAGIAGVAGIESVSGTLDQAGVTSPGDLGEGVRFFDGSLLFRERTVAVQRVWLLPGAEPGPVRQEILDRVAPIPRDRVSLVGPAAFNARIDALSRRESQQVVPLAVLAVFLLQALLFGSWTRAAVLTGSSLVAVFACLGAFGWAGVRLNFLTVNVPLLAFVISTALGIHPLWCWLRLGGRCGKAMPRPGKVALRTFPGCLLSALTTGVGFGSLAGSDVAAVREFGVLTAVAVPTAFACSLATTPLMLGLLARASGNPLAAPPGVASRTVSGAVNAPRAFPGRLFAAFSGFVPRHASALRLSAAVALVASIAFVLRLRVENDPLDLFAQGDAFRLECDRVERDIEGLAPVEILVTFDGQGSLASRLRRVDAMARAVERVTGLGRVASIVEPLELAAAVVGGGHYALPGSDSVLALLYRGLVSRAPEVRHLVDDAGRTFRLILPFNLLDAGSFRDLLARATDVLRQFGGAEIRPTGLIYRLMTVQDRILDEQLSSLGLAAVGIAVLVGGFFGSLQAMALTLLVNSFPLLVAAAVMSLVGVPLDLTTSMVASVAIGIAVDDTIHFLWEYRATAREVGGELAPVLDRVGFPIAATSIVLVAGFCCLGLADFPPIARFGWLVALTLALALVSQLVILPACLRLAPGCPSRPVLAERAGAFQERVGQ